VLEFYSYTGQVGHYDRGKPSFIQDAGYGFPIITLLGNRVNRATDRSISGTNVLYTSAPATEIVISVDAIQEKGGER
jgi:hypothetical protein